MSGMPKMKFIYLYKYRNKNMKKFYYTNVVW